MCCVLVRRVACSHGECGQGADGGRRAADDTTQGLTSYCFAVPPGSCFLATRPFFAAVFALLVLAAAYVDVFLDVKNLAWTRERLESYFCYTSVYVSTSLHVPYSRILPKPSCTRIYI